MLQGLEHCTNSSFSVRNSDGFNEILEWSQLLLVNQAKLLHYISRGVNFSAALLFLGQEC
jgi:hypothetical protein